MTEKVFISADRGMPILRFLQSGGVLTCAKANPVKYFAQAGLLVEKRRLPASRPQTFDDARVSRRERRR